MSTSLLIIFCQDCEEEIERWKGLYEEQSARELELTKNIENKFQVLYCNVQTPFNNLHYKLS